MSVKAKYPTCRHCGAMLTYRTNRPWWIKAFLFWLPLKRYYCGKCFRSTYIIDPSDN